MKMLKALPKTLRVSLLDENPVFFCCAFLCPALAASASVSFGLRLGLAAAFTLTCTGVCCALLRPLVHERLRFICFALVAAFFAAAAELFLRAYSPVFWAQMSFFVPLVAVGCMTLCLNGFADEGGVLACGLRGLLLGLGAVLAFCLAGVVRALLADGVLGGWQLFGESYPHISLFDTPAGAFLALGLTAGLFQFAANINLPARKKVEAPTEIKPATEAEAAAETIADLECGTKETGDENTDGGAGI